MPDPDSATAARETTVITQPALGQGAIAYLAYCAVCHGAGGAGDGPLAAELATQGAERRVAFGDRTRLDELGHDGIANAIAVGGRHTGRSNLMPPWSALIDEQTASAIADHILTLPDTLSAPMAQAMSSYLASPIVDAPEARETYVYFCSACHGTSGKGDGLAAAMLMAQQGAHPRDLTDRRYFADRTDGQLTAALSLGGGHVGRAIYMSAWNHPFTFEQVADLVAYVRFLSHTRPAQVASAPQ